jgi:hypothetical protein
MVQSSMIVVNTDTQEAHVVPQNEAELLTNVDKFHNFMMDITSNNRYISSYVDCNTGSSRYCYVCSIGEVDANDIYKGIFKAYPDTPASRVLYLEK